MQPNNEYLTRYLQDLEMRIGTGVKFWTNTRAELLAAAGAVNGDVGAVLTDGNAGYRGIYRRDGGAWARIADLPQGFVDGMAALGAVDAETQRATAAETEIRSRLDGAIAGGPVVGDWDAGSVVFPMTRPGGSPVLRADAWRVIGAGTVDGVAFEVGDYLQAIRDGGGVTFAGNWGRGALGEMVTARDSAAASAAQAALYDGPRVNRFIELSGLTPLLVAVGQYVQVRQNGAWYQRVASGGHIDYSGSGGIRLNVMQRESGFAAVDFGMKADGVASWTNATITSGLPGLFVTGAAFTAADVGKLIVVSGAGAAGADLRTTIQAVTDAQNIVLAANAGTSRTAVPTLVRYGSNDLTALNLALASAEVSPGVFVPVVLPPAMIFINGTLVGLNRNGRALIGPDRAKCTIVKYDAAAFSVDAFASGSGSDPFISVSLAGFTVEGTSATPVNVFLQGISFSSRLEMDVREGNPISGIAFQVAGCMSSRWDLRCSNNLTRQLLGRVQHSIPYEGLRVQSGTRAGVNVGRSSNNYFWVALDGMAIGLRRSASDQNTFQGAAQACSVYGVLGSADQALTDTFIDFGMENAGATADLSEAGTGTVFINCYASQKIILAAQSKNIDWQGGKIEALEVLAGARGYKFRRFVHANWHTGVGITGHTTGIGGSITQIEGCPITASASGTTLTVTAIAQWADGLLAVGSPISWPGSPAGLTIATLGTGTGGTGTYTLSANVGTVASRVMKAEVRGDYAKPRVSITTMPGGGTYTWKNNRGVPTKATVQINPANMSATVTGLKVIRQSDSWVVAGGFGAVVDLMPGDSLETTYTGSPGPLLSCIDQNVP